MSTALVRSISPNTFLKKVAMFLCWTILQWSSMERMMGQLHANTHNQINCITHILEKITISKHHTNTDVMWVHQGHSLRCDEGMFLDGVQHIAELDLGGKGVTVVDDRHSIRTVPAVHCKKNKKAHTLQPPARNTTTQSHATNHKTTDVVTLVEPFIYIAIYTTVSKAALQ